MRERRNCLVFRYDSALCCVYECLPFKNSCHSGLAEVLPLVYLWLCAENQTCAVMQRTGCPVHWLPLHIALLRERLIPIKRFCHPSLTNSALLTRHQQKMCQQNKLQLVMRKTNHAALPSFSCLSLLFCLGLHIRPGRSHLPSRAEVSKAGKHVFLSDISVHFRDRLCPSGYSPRWSRLHGLGREGGREEADLKACQQHLPHFQKRGLLPCCSVSWS